MRQQVRDVSALVLYIIHIVRTHVHLLWIRVHNFLGPYFDFAFTRVSRSDHKIVVVGDGFAQGFGDWVVMGSKPGVCGRLEDIIRKNARVRKKWRVYSRGKYMTTSADWLPPTDVTDSASRRASLFDGTFGRGAFCADADIVVVAVGYNDHAHDIEPKQTCENIRILGETLRSRGKLVYVCALPRVRKSRALVNRPRNMCIEKFLTKCRAETKSEGQILAGPKLNLFQVPSLFGFDGARFSSKGYSLFASRLFQDILPGMTRVEFNSFKSQIFSSGPSKGKR